MLYVCYSVNDTYVPEAGISLTGFFENNPDYEPEEVFFLDYGIFPDNKWRLDRMAANYGRRITYLPAKAYTDEVKRRFPQLKGWKGSMAPNAKPFVDKIMPDYVDRLLFIDADTVVTGSVAPLSSLDMCGAALGVVPSNWITQDVRKGRLSLISGNRFYFNSGVLLFDLAAWRRENCHQMIIDTLDKEIDLTWPDQSLLNNAIPERLLCILPLKYNYRSHNFHPSQERGWMRIGHNQSDAEIEESIQHPVIVHFMDGWPNGRPWHEQCRSSRKDDYLHYKALSPWKDLPLYPARKLKSPKGFRKKCKFWLIHQMCERRPFWLIHLIHLLLNRY